ncbi:hypothetical protein DBV05_g4751 [Lasiodiplodia theobromae]|uniref:Uncharacterized protein n=1 Tax=Lasiodiplodia theobromae TaxID=45133 RepID=A0A5N5DFP2_9PEZI|nr:hypothetical protein DBV05_g4751 [Lasiodiplodia theobromae]
MEQTTSSDDPGFCLKTTINAEEPPPYSEQKNSSPDFDFDQAAPAEVEKQPRAIDWSDIVTASAWPQVILALLHIPTMLFPQSTLLDIGFPQPWVRNDRLCFISGCCLGPAVLSSFQGNHLGRMLLYKAFLPILWQQLVATYLESTELGWWWKEMVGWVLVVAGGQLLILTTNLYLGEYAWPEAPQEEQRKALEKSLERRREAFEAEEEARHEYRRKWGGEGKKEQAEAGADGRQYGDACSVKDLKAGVDGKWEVTDELIATVFKILQDIGLFKIESG